MDSTDYNSATLFDYSTLETLYPEFVEDFNSTNKTGYIDPVNECCFFGDRYWYHPDYLGSVAMVTNDEGVVHQFLLTNAWGEELHTYNNANTSSFNSEYRFNGKEFDEETGLAYYGARYYDNKMSMWLSVDPLATDPKQVSISPYHFTGNNPVMLVDPDGNIWGDPDDPSSASRDEAHVEGLRKVYQEREAYYRNEVKKYDQQILDLESSSTFSEDSEEYKSLLEERSLANAGAIDMANAQVELKRMGETENYYYTFKGVAEGSNTVELNPEIRNNGDGTLTYIIPYREGVFQRSGTKSHEVKHAYQLLEHYKAFFSMDVRQKEGSAYIRQYFTQPSSMPVRGWDALRIFKDPEGFLTEINNLAGHEVYNIR